MTDVIAAQGAATLGVKLMPSWTFPHSVFLDSVSENSQ